MSTESEVKAGADSARCGWDSDLSDGRQKDEWQSVYPAEARKGIRGEIIYLGILLLLCVSGVFYIIFELYGNPTSFDPALDSEQKHSPRNLMCLGYLGAYIAGTLGGCTCGIKWMYHIVAKRRWHEDRRLWRVFSPHLSGVVSLIMTFLAGSGILHLFDPAFSERPIGMMALSFLVGYFSDKALRKLAEVADTLFGSKASGS